jgi:hypothetical protein
MSDQHFLRCNCQYCGESIEFPAHGAGLEFACPHCGQKTLLFDPTAALETDPPLPSSVDSGPSPESDMELPRAGKSRVWVCALVLSALAVLAAGGWYFLAGPGARHPEPSVAEKPEPPAAKTPEPEPGIAKSVPTNPSTNLPGAEQAESSRSLESAQRPSKSIDDLKPGPVSLEKAKAGSLVHAVGTIKNASDQQRFGVRVELELTDARGNPAGKASDYTQVIEPRAEWRFRALVVDPKGSRATAGRVSSIKEDN